MSNDTYKTENTDTGFQTTSHNACFIINHFIDFCRLRHIRNSGHIHKQTNIQLNRSKSTPLNPFPNDKF